MDSQIFIKTNEDKEVKDFTFVVPDNCTFEFAKRGALATYEHLVKLEQDAIRNQAAEKAKEEENTVS